MSGMIETPDGLSLAWHDPERCKEESPAWGYEGEGEQCQRKLGHDGPHYTTGRDASGGQAVIQWEIQHD